MSEDTDWPEGSIVGGPARRGTVIALLYLGDDLADIVATLNRIREAQRGP